MKKDTSWNAVADWYDDVVSDVESYQQEVIVPNLMRLAGDVNGKSVLDIACGQGFFSEVFAKVGAAVVGVDLSPELVRRASSRAPQARFLVGSAERLPNEVASGSFDLAICVLALQNIKGLDASVSEVARSLKESGRFLIVLNHPAFRIPKSSSWGFDDAAAVQYRRLDRYMSDSQIEIEMNPSNKKGETTMSFHRPLQVYFKSFAKNSFSVTRLEEWISNKTSQSGPRKRAEDTARKEFPLFLMLELRKS